jgi:hypothetical protein
MRMETWTMWKQKPALAHPARVWDMTKTGECPTCGNETLDWPEWFYYLMLLVVTLAGWGFWEFVFFLLSHLEVRIV